MLLVQDSSRIHILLAYMYQTGIQEQVLNNLNFSVIDVAVNFLNTFLIYTVCWVSDDLLA
jgi:hypothetical protein